MLMGKQLKGSCEETGSFFSSSVGFIRESRAELVPMVLCLFAFLQFGIGPLHVSETILHGAAHTLLLISKLSRSLPIEQSHVLRSGDVCVVNRFRRGHAIGQSAEERINSIIYVGLCQNVGLRKKAATREEEGNVERNAKAEALSASA